MKRDPEWFGEDVVELVQLSRKLREAKAVEAALDASGLDYAVEADEYQARMLLVFPTTRVGAFFYVRPPDAAAARALLRERGFEVIEADEGDEGDAAQPA